MNKYLLIVLTTLLLLPSDASAVSDENVTKRRPDKPAQAQIQEIKQEVRTKVAEKHASRIEKRFTSYYTRFNNIITRFQTRLDMLKVAGKDTLPTQVKLDLAKSKLTEAKAKSDVAIATFTLTEVSVAKDLSISARELFKETHNLLKDALKSLKTISKPALPAAKEAL